MRGFTFLSLWFLLRSRGIQKDQEANCRFSRASNVLYKEPQHFGQYQHLVLIVDRFCKKDEQKRPRKKLKETLVEKTKVLDNVDLPAKEGKKFFPRSIRAKSACLCVLVLQFVDEDSEGV